MLADLRDVAGVECVVSRIEELRLGRRFAVVLLGSHLVNTPEPQRGEILAAARRHAADGADLMAEVYPPGMRWTEAQASHAGPVEIHLEDVTRVGSRISATVVYGLRERSWRQRFQAEMLDEPRLREVLAASGLRFERWLDESRGWLLARPARGEPLRAT
jgi:hypothetical protein